MIAIESQLAVSQEIAGFSGFSEELSFEIVQQWEKKNR